MMPVSLLRSTGLASERSRTQLLEFVQSCAGAASTANRSTLPFTTARALRHNGQPTPDLPDRLSVVRVAANTALLIDGFPNDIRQDLPLGTHRFETPDAVLQASTAAAFDFLNNHYAEGYQLCTRYLHLLVFVTRTGCPQDDESLLTSCSMPAVPFCTFVSRKALQHLPPLHLAAQPEPAVFAENLFHEALHNALTVDMLMGNVFNADFRASLWPRVPIPWRAKDAEARNRTWPVDRALHALFVYVGLVGMRIAVITDPTVEERHRQFITSTLPSAARAMRHLAAALSGLNACFTPRGLAAVTALRESAVDCATQLGSA